MAGQRRAPASKHLTFQLALYASYQRWIREHLGSVLRHYLGPCTITPYFKRVAPAVVLAGARAFPTAHVNVVIAALAVHHQLSIGHMSSLIGQLLGELTPLRCG